jgi:hypothetical protein
MFLATFAGSDTTYDLCTVSNGLFRVIGSLLASEALNDDLKYFAETSIFTLF